MCVWFLQLLCKYLKNTYTYICKYLHRTKNILLITVYNIAIMILMDMKGG